METEDTAAEGGGMLMKGDQSSAKDFLKRAEDYSRPRDDV